MPAGAQGRKFAALACARVVALPGFRSAEFARKLARFANWTPDGVIAGNGSNELIQALLMVTIGEGRRVLISEPTFALYRQVATVLGGEVISVPLTSALTYNVDALLYAIKRDEPDVTIICSPNNPTGCVMSDDELKRLLEATGGIVAVDEAYFEFATHTVVPLLKAHKNLVVFRTFSKAMAMAALRVGYLWPRRNSRARSAKPCCLIISTPSRKQLPKPPSRCMTKHFCRSSKKSLTSAKIIQRTRKHRRINSRAVAGKLYAVAFHMKNRDVSSKNFAARHTCARRERLSDAG
jgi:hypothetical protein